MLSTFIMLILAACILTAVWPLLILPGVRPALLAGVGSSCMAIGTTTIGLLAGGFAQLPAFAAEARAADAALPSDKELTPSPPAASAADPEIEATSPDTVVIPPGRPEWVEKEPDFSGDVHSIPVSSGPFKHETECKRALDKEIIKVTREYIIEQLGSELAAQFIRYDARAIKERLLKAGNVYHETIEIRDPVGKMHQTHALLTFDPKFRKELDAKWTKVRGASRLGQLGFFAVGGLLLIASVFGYFRLDNATRGYYTGRLQFMTAAAILAVITAGAVLSQWMTWL